MIVGYPVVYRLTQAELDAGDAVSLNGGFIEIVDGNGVPTGSVYATGVTGSNPTSLGGSLVSVRTAHQHLQSYRIVYDMDGAAADLADPTDITKCLTILGMTTSVVPSGSAMSIMSRGETAAPPGLSVGPMYLGAGGTITQAFPTTGVLVKLGYVAGGTKLIVNIEQPIVLA